MGTIIADNSHFAAFDRSLLLRQATVIATGSLPCFSTCMYFAEKFTLIFPPGVLRPEIRMVRCASSGFLLL